MTTKLKFLVVFNCKRLHATYTVVGEAEIAVELEDPILNVNFCCIAEFSCASLLRVTFNVGESVIAAPAVIMVGGGSVENSEADRPSGCPSESENCEPTFVVIGIVIVTRIFDILESRVTDDGETMRVLSLILMGKTMGLEGEALNSNLIGSEVHPIGEVMGPGGFIFTFSLVTVSLITGGKL